MREYILRACIVISLLFAGFSLVAPHADAARSETIDSGKTNATLLSTHNRVAPGERFHLALMTALDEHWHTYWRNPGDSGEPVTLEWNVPETLTQTGEIVWPLPMTIPTGPLVNYAFEGRPIFPVEFQMSDTANIGDRIEIILQAYYLVCKDICIPENAELRLTLEVGESEIDPLSDVLIANAIDDSPKPGDVTGQAVKSGQTLSLNFDTLPERDAGSELYFFPDISGLIDHAAPQVLRAQSISVPTGFVWTTDPVSDLTGVLQYVINGKPTGQEVSLAVRVEPTPAGDDASQSDIAQSTGNAATDSQAPGANSLPPSTSLTFLPAIIFAFLGGLILNLMPCVFPIVSLKALTITKLAHGERRAIRREAWAYAAGVFATFIVLTGIFLIFKQGWGVQLQSPIMVGGLAILLFVIGLNLLGVFDIGGRLQFVGGDLSQKSGLSGSFFTGLLAVIVATPCTAPFMSTALGYTLTQPAHIGAMVFMALAFGFTAPFLLLAYIPGLAKILPKPGPWMVRFKEILAFPMLAAAIWLVWVLSAQTGDTGVVTILSAMLLVGFAVWLLRLSQGILKTIPIVLSLIGAVFLVSTLKTDAPDYVAEDVWSVERVAELRAQGQPVFVDFTAAWCITCQANKKAVLDTQAVKDLFADYDTALLVADWTNKNDVIAAELAKHGRAGVPLYLLYPPGNDDVKPVILPQILSEDVLSDALGNI